MTRSGSYITQATGYKAFIPSPLPPNPPIDLGKLENQLNKAYLMLTNLNTIADMLPHIDQIIAMYVRKEAVLSSQIEGTQATLENIFSYENHLPIQNIHDVEEVVHYIKALNHGLKRIKEFPMSVRLIKEIHQILLSNSRGKEKEPGEFRRSQNWIGPPGSTLKNASFIPPPPQDALKALGDLELFLHKDTGLPPLISCGLMHYQFETIHPFLDGNGRLGRLLITFYLCWKGMMNKPLLTLSYYFKLHRQEYYDRLNLVRFKGDYEQWLSFFLEGVIWTAESSMDTIKKVLEISKTHQNLLTKKKITSHFAFKLLDFLLAKPFISTQDAKNQLNTSFPTAQNLINQFEDLGILKEITGKKRERVYSYWEYLDCLGEGTF